MWIVQFSHRVHWIPTPKKHGYRARNHVSRSIGRENVTKSPFFGNTVVKIWQYHWSNSFLIGSTEFYALKNMVIEPKIMFLGQLEGKMWQKNVFWQHCYGNLAALLIAHFSNWFQWIPRPQKRGYRAQNYVSRPIRSKVMMKIVINQSKFPLKSHLCDVIKKSRFPAT